VLDPLPGRLACRPPPVRGCARKEGRRGRAACARRGGTASPGLLLQLGPLRTTARAPSPQPPPLACWLATLPPASVPGGNRRGPAPLLPPGPEPARRPPGSRLEVDGVRWGSSSWTPPACRWSCPDWAAAPLACPAPCCRWTRWTPWPGLGPSGEVGQRARGHPGPWLDVGRTHPLRALTPGLARPPYAPAAPACRLGLRLLPWGCAPLPLLRRRKASPCPPAPLPLPCPWSAAGPAAGPAGGPGDTPRGAPSRFCAPGMMAARWP